MSLIPDYFVISFGLILTKTFMDGVKMIVVFLTLMVLILVTSFLKRQDLDLICRAHQVVEDGYEFFAKRQLVTLFSAPNYCGEFDNAGAMMSVDETLMCSFQVCFLKPLFETNKNI